MLTPEQILSKYVAVGSDLDNAVIWYTDALKAINEYLSQQSGIPAEERAKELYPFLAADGSMYNSNYNSRQVDLQSAYLTGYKEALQQPVSPVDFLEWVEANAWVKVEGLWTKFDVNTGTYTTAELYQQYLQTLK